MLSITLVGLAGIFALQYSGVQTYVSKRVASYLSEQLHAKISLTHIYFKPFNALELKGFSINDRHGKPILNAKRLTANLSLYKLWSNKLEINHITLEETFFHYELYEDSTNITFLIDYFNPKKKEKDKEEKSLALDLKEITLIDNHFKLTNHRALKQKQGVDFNYLDLKDLSGQFKNIRHTANEVRSDIHGLRFKDQSGFILKKLSAESYVSTSKMEFAHLDLQTNQSKLGDYLAFYYNNFSDFKDFIHKVKIEGTLNNAKIDSKDIVFFAPAVTNVRFQSSIQQASVSGTVSDIQAREVHLETGRKTSLKGDFRITGLPYIEKTLFNFDVDELQTSAKDVELLVPLLSNRTSLVLPKQLHLLGQITYRGALKGYYHQFNIHGVAQTGLGGLLTDTEIRIRPHLQYAGLIETSAFSLGSFLQSKNLARTGIKVKFDGEGIQKEDLKLRAKGSFRNFSFKNYVYQQINFETDLFNQILSAKGDINDPNASLSFKGEVDWQEGLPAYQLSSDIEIANLKKLNIFQKDSIVVFKSNLEANLNGNSLNTLNGHISSDHIQFYSSRGEFSMAYLTFESQGNEQSKQLTIKSDVVDGIMFGQIDLNTIGPYFSSLAMRYAPAINIEQKAYNPQNFDLSIHIKSFNPISALFDPHLQLEDGAHLQATFSSDNYTARFKAFSPTLSYKGMKITNLILNENADDKAFSLDVTADRFSFSDSAYIDKIRINNLLANDSLTFKIGLSETNRANYLNLNGNIHFAHNQPAYIKFDRSDIMLNDEQWTVNQNADIRVSKGKFYLNNLLLTRDKQQINLNGILSNADDNLDIGFKDFSLASLSGITKPLGIQLQGHLSGDVRINSIFSRPNLSTHISTTPIIYNNLPIGNLTINADFDPENALLQLQSKLLDVDGNGLDLVGTYDLADKENALKLQGKIKDMDLGIAYPFLRGLISNLYGKISGDVMIGGTIQRPIINGSTSIKEASFIVNYLQTRYNLANQKAVIRNNSIFLSNFKFADVNNATANTNGSINLNTITDPTLDFRINTDNFQILNTTRKDNDLFFGTAYASGNFRFNGPTSAINIDITARSNPNTTINIPFNTSLKVSENDFFYFIHPDSGKHEQSTRRSMLKGLSMNMDLSLTSDAEINLENNIGSLKSLGNGNITLKISNLGDFEMFGDYHVTSGKFHFTAQDFFNKFFDLKEGGTIRWAGNPSEAVVNLSATYQQRTSIAPLYNAAGRTENNDRILAQADMILKGTLSQPEVSFDLNFPQDPYVKDELQGYLSDGNNVNQQAISLIVRRSFTPASTQEFGREVNNTLLSAGTEIAFNQLNSIISQSLNMNFLDLNIRSFNDASASLRFFDDRLIFTGGVTDRSKNQVNDLTLFSDQIATDAEVTFRLRQDGNLVLRAYNRLNTRNFLFTPYSDYISAVGLVYRQEFNSLSEFWRKLWIWNERKKKEEEDAKKEAF